MNAIQLSSEQLAVQHEGRVALARLEAKKPADVVCRSLRETLLALTSCMRNGPERWLDDLLENVTHETGRAEAALTQ